MKSLSMEKIRFSSLPPLSSIQSLVYQNFINQFFFIPPTSPTFLNKYLVYQKFINGKTNFTHSLKF